MESDRLSRRGVLGGLAGAGLAGAGLANTAFAAGAAAPKLPARPVTLNIVDVAGNLALTRPAFEAYAAANPHLVSHITYNQAPAPELPGKLHAQQSAGRLDIDLVLTGTDALAAGIKQKIWAPLYPNYAAALPDPAKIFAPAVLKMQALAANQGLCVVFCPAGPELQYNPDKVKQVPTTPAELLAWAKQNPKRFIYADPNNSGPARIFMMGLPYLLGDKDPHDPEHGWDKTWAYLAELGKTIQYYPAGTGAVMQELGSGLRDMTPAHIGWYVNTRALGVVPATEKLGLLKGGHIVCDAQFMCVPKGVASGKLAVLLDLMRYMMTPKAQAVTYDSGYFYPGPAVKDVPLSMAPQKSQEIVAKFRDPGFDALLKTAKLEVPLSADAFVYAAGRWSKTIGRITAG